MSLKKSIKQILREEIENDLSWVRDYYFQEDPLFQVKSFIFNKMKDCELIPSEETSGWTWYINKQGDRLFMDDIEDPNVSEGYLFLDYGKVWGKCKKMGASNNEIERISIDMLNDLYGRKVNRAFPNYLNYI